MFENIELYLDIIELRNLGLTDEDIEGYISFFYSFEKAKTEVI